MTETNNPPFDSKLPPMCNAWIFLNDDYPEGTNYNSPNSMYQDLISKKVYEAMDIINLSFISKNGIYSKLSLGFDSNLTKLYNY